MSDIKQILLDLAEDARLKAEQIDEQLDEEYFEDSDLPTEFYFKSGESAAYENIANVLAELASKQ